MVEEWGGQEETVGCDASIDRGDAERWNVYR